MRQLVGANLRFFILGTLAAILLRLIFLLRFPGVVNDSFVYGDIAKNWLQHGIYGLSGPEEISPTYIRLPGYPAFLAFIFALFGVEHYRAVLVAQLLVDLGTCLICADLARRLLGERASKIAFLLTALCPFLADYSAAALTETLEIFFTALALDCAIAGLQNWKLSSWAGCGVSCAAAILLRPDGAMLPFVVIVYIGWHVCFPSPRSRLLPARPQLLRAALLVAILSILPLVPWTVRNWHVFHRFQPLAPRYANEEAEFVPMGFNRWVKTWMADYTSVEDIYWPVPGSAIDASRLPSRAFDTAQQQAATLQLIDDYNQALHISPELDQRFEALAAERIHMHPLRYYVGLPLLRILDMWARPRTEMLPSDSRWWEFNDELRWSVLAVWFAAINLFYILCALVGWMRERKLLWGGLLVLLVVLRSAFLGSLENPEPRYTLEMYPVAIVYAAAAFIRKREAAP
ncbi:MAG TPA: glycosyltransferase family 39 protein [Terriglobales bacterium]